MREQKTTGVMVRLHQEDISAIDAWRRQQPDLPTRPEAIRRLVHAALKSTPTS
jgi:hypothetical protein